MAKGHFVMHCIFRSLLYIISFLLAPSIAAKTFTITQQIELAEHLLPAGPARDALDKIFRMNKDPNVAFRMAGCEFLKAIGRLVVTHQEIPGFVLKATSNQKQQSTDVLANIISSNRNLKRILMNERIRACVEKYSLQKYIYVPQKYIYHIPETPTDFSDAHYIIIAEKLDLFCEECNRHQFAFHMTGAEEQAVLSIIEEVGYADAALHNICYLKSGMIAFIDTENIYAVDILESLGFSKVLHALAARRGRKQFEEECKKLRRYKRSFVWESQCSMCDPYIATLQKTSWCEHLRNGD